MSRRDLGLLVALSAIWGSSFLFIKVGVEELEPAVVVCGRLLVGALVLLPVALARGGLSGLRAMLVPIAVLGALNNALPYWLLSFAETRIDSGLAAVIQAAAPIFTVLLAIRIDPSQRVTGLRLAGVGLGFVGVALLVGLQEGAELLGAVAVVGTALCYAVSVLYAGRAIRSFSPLDVSIGQLSVGALLTLPAALVQWPAETPSAKVVGAVLVLGVLGTGVAYLLYFALIVRAGASRAILVTYLVPAFALVYGWLILGEAVTPSALAGLALILGGTALATGGRLRRR
ncbi:DMT family transporter [Gaiella sp.]|jgi:drug/metabolite transporter (DMT)-like permease|uniref:DMT family transporter n=1 Tax=Gaiella sp. TaxID=2663207 RepID=UPI002C6C20CF|nr:DMT family transporter [Gaiella sp.]HWO81957.1 DMT family transporter [Gaiella sp.]